MEKKIVKVLEVMASIILVVLVVSVVVQIAAREIFHVSASWSVDLCRACFTAIVFIGTPIVVSEESHLSILMVKDAVGTNPKYRLLFDVFGDIVIYFALITLIYGTFNRAVSEWDSKIITIEWLTYGYIYAVMLFGSLGTLYMQILHTKKYVDAFLRSRIEK